MKTFNAGLEKLSHLKMLSSHFTLAFTAFDYVMPQALQDETSSQGLTSRPISSSLPSHFDHLSFLKDIGVMQTSGCCFWLLETYLKVNKLELRFMPL